MNKKPENMSIEELTAHATYITDLLAQRISEFAHKNDNDAIIEE